MKLEKILLISILSEISILSLSSCAYNPKTPKEQYNQSLITCRDHYNINEIKKSDKK